MKLARSAAAPIARRFERGFECWFAPTGLSVTITPGNESPIWEARSTFRPNAGARKCMIATLNVGPRDAGRDCLVHGVFFGLAARCIRKQARLRAPGMSALKASNRFISGRRFGTPVDGRKAFDPP
jgi:hypothetical protein